MRRRSRPVFLGVGAPDAFPDPRTADEDGLLAVGGDLSMGRLLCAYESGIFPWYDVGLPPLWWSPDPRAIMTPDRLHVSRSMQRFLRNSPFSVSCNRAFRHVMVLCAERDGGTWILPEMIDAYVQLHEGGHALSFEVWHQTALVGGLYGVRVGGLFAAESMFHRETNASKLALIAAIQSLFAAGVRLFDVQFLTSHLESLGAHTIPRDDYLARLEDALGLAPPGLAAPKAILP
ncbi:MAG TPA: leucyl/phenylalanyl-tRNA--protein transferase [Polyangiaceae bacterium]|nr:leucyl/phenylalanyl-tRNA--protein transferase [Polyangiaceae bacterium]